MLKKFVFFVLCLFLVFEVSLLVSEKSGGVPEDLLDIDFVPDALVFEDISEFGGKFYLENYGLSPTRVDFFYELRFFNGLTILHYHNFFVVETSRDFYGNFSRFGSLELSDGVYEFFFVSKFGEYEEVFEYRFLVRKGRIYDLNMENYILWTQVMIGFFCLVAFYFVGRIFLRKKRKGLLFFPRWKSFIKGN